MDKSSHITSAANGLSAISTYQAGVKLASVGRSLQRLCDEILAPFGITKAQWFVIGLVWDAGKDGIRATELASQTDTSMAYLTNTLNLLESKAILTRNDHHEDSRSKLITLNPTFRGQCEAIEQTLRQRLRESIYRDVDPAEFRIYMKVMYQLADVSV